jgi:hypothetical protein
MGAFFGSTTFTRITDYQTRWCFFPRRCASSNKLLWMRPAVRGTHIIFGPGGAIDQVFWFDPKEFTILKLKGNL